MSFTCRNPTFFAIVILETTFPYGKFSQLYSTAFDMIATTYIFCNGDVCASLHQDWL